MKKYLYYPTPTFYEITACEYFSSVLIVRLIMSLRSFDSGLRMAYPVNQRKH